MNTTNIFISVGVGIGAIIAIALYRFFKRNTSSVVPLTSDECEKVEIVSYDMILTWLKNKRKTIKIVGGDKLFILQDSIAKDSFKKIYPHDSILIGKSSILCIGIIRNEEVITSKFFIYEVMAKSLSEMLPKDPKKSFVQKIED